ncbi:MAG: tryptophanase [Bacteroidales bacterium]|nr:tryptophanase [Bacteroidales bacterium]MCB9013647.1 tryptophanase [Bacteroidales bacterium]
MLLPNCESYKIKMIEPIYQSTKEQRLQWLRDAKYNLFNLRSEQVFIDLLTDSGTGAMSDRQWAELMSGDESYAGSRSYYKLKDTIKDIFGFEYFLPTHQGRAAENVLFSCLVKAGDKVPGNAHFDTTKGHIEFRKATAIDCTIDEASDSTSVHPFKGNIDLIKLEQVLKSDSPENIPFIMLTITCNTFGGQPVSIENIRGVHKLSRKYGIPLFFDSARFAENAWFIHEREEEFRGKSIPEIVKEMYRYADGMTMSSKKDGIVNIGGFIGLRDEKLYKLASTFNIMFEGFNTYGGMAGRDMAALAQGLKEVIDKDYLDTRIRQVHYLGSLLTDEGIPVQQPIGGHAVFIDALKFLPHIKREEFVAQTLALEIYLEAGIRGVEIGALMADRDPVSRENRFPQMEMVRLAIPRRVYTNSHMDYIAAAIKNVYKRRESIRSGYRILNEAPILRHFTIELEKIPVIK